MYLPRRERERTAEHDDLAVIAELNADGVYEIKGTWTVEALSCYGAALATVAQPEQVADANRMLLPGANLVPGRPLLLGGMVVTLSPFWYDKADGTRKRWAGETGSDDEAFGTETLTAPAAVSGVRSTFVSA